MTTSKRASTHFQLELVVGPAADTWTPWIGKSTVEMWDYVALRETTGRCRRFEASFPAA
jgi:hypothetical protein